MEITCNTRNKYTISIRKQTKKDEKFCIHKGIDYNFIRCMSTVVFDFVANRVIVCIIIDIVNQYGIERGLLNISTACL